VLNNGEIIFNTKILNDKAIPAIAKVNSSLESTAIISIAHVPHIMMSSKENKCFMGKILRVNNYKIKRKRRNIVCSVNLLSLPRASCWATLFRGYKVRALIPL
jgi:hypothetical protein